MLSSVAHSSAGQPLALERIHVANQIDLSQLDGNAKLIKQHTVSDGAESTTMRDFSDIREGMELEMGQNCQTRANAVANVFNTQMYKKYYRVGYKCCPPPARFNRV